MELATLLKNLLGRQLVQYLFWLNKQRIRRGGIRCTGYNIRYLVEYMVCLRTYQTTDRFYGIWKVEILSLYHKDDSNVSKNGQGSYFYDFKRCTAFYESQKKNLPLSTFQCSKSVFSLFPIHKFLWQIILRL